MNLKATTNQKENLWSLIMGGQLTQIIKFSKMLGIDQALVFPKTPLVQGIHLPISIQLAHSMVEVLVDVMPPFIKSVLLLQIGK